MNDNKKMKLGYVFAISSALFYAIQIILGKLILQTGMATFDLLLIQFTGTTTILGLFLLSRRNLSLFQCSKPNLIKCGMQGVFGSAATSILLYLAMEEINAGIASMLLYLCPIFVCLFFMITGIRKISLSNKIAVVVSFLGAFLVLNIFPLKDASISVLGIVLGVLSGITYAFYSIFADLKLREIKTETLLFYMYVCATAAIYIINFDFFIHPPQIESTSVFLLLCLSSVFQVMPMALLNLAIRTIGSNKTSIIITAELPFTIILAFFVLGEAMVFTQVIGIFLIVSAILILQMKKTNTTDIINEQN